MSLTPNLPQLANGAQELPYWDPYIDRVTRDNGEIGRAHV